MDELLKKIVSIIIIDVLNRTGRVITADFEHLIRSESNNYSTRFAGSLQKR